MRDIFFTAKLYDINLPLVLFMIIIVFPIWICVNFWGLELSKKNNVFGILLLTITLNIIGTFIGCMMTYKKQNPSFKFWLGFKNKFKSIFKFKRKNKIKNKEQTSLQTTTENV